MFVFLRVFLIIMACLMPQGGQASSIKGIYGLPAAGVLPAADIDKMIAAGVNAVFAPADQESVAWYKSQGLEVYLSINVFGGTSAWRTYPDSRPVTATGKALADNYGGVCPTHKGWRAERLDFIGSLVERFSGSGLPGNGIDGIWLDFVRYPGKWEEKNPEIPDTCYCERCVQKFQQDKKVSIPAGLETPGVARWIRKNVPYLWMRWKKEQISSMVGSVRKIMEKQGDGNRLKLGVFLVPWAKGERNNAISFLLAQDPFELARLADVISPMVYHQLVGRRIDWVGEMAGYYKETARAEVWPVIQAGINGAEPGTDEFEQAVKQAATAGADGLLVFSFSGMTEGFWPKLREFVPPENLIVNPEFLSASDAKSALAVEAESAITGPGETPFSWSPGVSGKQAAEQSLLLVDRSVEFLTKFKRFLYEPDRPAIGITAGNDRAGVWSTALPACRPGDEYLFTAEMFRDSFENGVYPYLGFWGKEFRVDTLLQSQNFVPVRLHLACDAPASGLDHRIRETSLWQQPATRYLEPNRFAFINPYPGSTFSLRKPKLIKKAQGDEIKPDFRAWPFFSPDIFPIGVYGAGLDNLEKIKELGFNTVIIGGSGQRLADQLKKCHALGLRYLLVVPRDQDRLAIYIEQIDGLIRPGQAVFYVNDEPGIHPEPLNAARDIKRLLKARFPEISTAMAVLRPQVVRDYLDGADFFMLDQYPVPNMPMTWLSDSMDEAARSAGADRLASVIQAFSEPANGWPRLPTWQEMDCLAFLSIIHGSRGVFFFSYRHIGSTEEGRKSLGRVVGRLQRLYPWLLERNSEEPVNIVMVSPFRVDPQGRSAVHCAVKEKNGQALMLCANTIGTHVEAEVGVARSEINYWREVFSGQAYPVVQNNIRALFKPFEVKAFVGGQPLILKD